MNEPNKASPASDFAARPLARRLVDLVRGLLGKPAARAAPAEPFASGQFNPRFSYLAVLGLDGSLVHINDAVLVATGVRREDVLGRRFWDTDWWRGLPAAAVWPERLRHVLASGLPHVSLDEFRDTGGLPRTAQVAVSLIPDSAGKPEYFLVEGHDVTESMQALAQLRDKAATLTSAQRLAKLGSWSLEVATRRLSWSSETCRIHGVPQDQFESLTPERFLQHVHPDDLQGVRTAIGRALAGQRLFSYQYRFCLEDGGEKLVRGDGEAQFDAQGSVVGLVGTVIDVTEQERMRQSARRSESRWRSLADSSTEWYWEQDEEMRFTLVAGGRKAPGPPSTARMIGRRRWELPDSVALKTGWSEHRQALAARQPFHDFEYRVGSGPQARTFSVAGEPMYDDKGRFAGYCGTSREITSEKAAEERAREAAALLALATRLGRLGAWSMEAPDMTVTWSSEALAIYETQAHTTTTFAQAQEFIGADCRETLRAAVETCMAAGAPFDLELRATTALGRPIWVRIIGEAARDASGAVKRIQGAVQDISERKDAAENYRALSEQLTLTLESVTDAFMTLDREWRFTYVNREAERIFGRSRDELIGNIFWRQFPGTLGTVFHQQYERALAEFVTVRFEAFSETFRKWFLIVAYPSQQGLAVYFRDVTESRGVRTALVESEERFRLLFETSVDAILQTTPQGKVLRANPAACTMFGMTEQQLQQVGRDQLVAPEETGLAALMDARNQSGKAMAELTMLRADGSRLEVEATTSRFHTSDGAVLTNIVLRDITERLQFQQEILQLNSDLTARVRHRTAELERANSELKGFAHSLAHDLRAPIATITGFSGTLQESLAKAGSDRERHYVQRIRAAAQRMDEYIEALLSLASISQARLHMTEVDLSDIAASVLA
ncbi:MAG: sensor histidine kinase, partial [Ramlibacter sp.]|nr:sensor histidine kinase [Ramlibacter sp.]